MTVNDLAQFLADRYQEAEAIARLVEPCWPGTTITEVLADPAHYAFKPHDVSPTRARHIMATGPAHRLADIKLKRAILALHAPSVLGSCSVCVTDQGGYPGEWLSDDYPCVTVRQLGTEFNGHEAYRAEWRPEA